MINIGLSGCDLNLINDNTIRKTSRNKNYDNRLILQAKKQIHFTENYHLKTIKSPTIKNIGDNFFDMDYIPSSSFQSFFLSSSKRQLNHFCESLFDYFDSVSFERKICNNNLIEKLQSLNQNTRYEKFINYIIKLLEKTDIILPMGFCHGDLTMSNILFKRDRYYFIDFLDSHLETPYYDLSKLKQDLYYKWSLKINDIKNLKIEQGFNYVWNTLYEKYSNKFESEEFQFIDALTLLRIESYATNNNIKDILHSCVEKLELYEKFNTTNSGKI